MRIGRRNEKEEKKIYMYFTFLFVCQCSMSTYQKNRIILFKIYGQKERLKKLKEAFNQCTYCLQLQTAMSHDITAEQKKIS